MLSFKLSMLIALTLASRTQSIQHLSIEDMKKTRDGYILCYKHLHKHSKPGKDSAVAYLKVYPPDRRLCVVMVLKEYLERTSVLREGISNLFISYVKPYRAVTKDTISRWLKTTMSLAGIDCTIFKTHSIRSAAVSKAKVNFVPIDDILKTAGWTNTKTFGTYYDKPMSTQVTFQDGVLKL